MTKRYPTLSGKQVMSCLLKLWFTFISQKGSHVKICKIEKEAKRTVIIPMHDELAIWTLKSILLQADISIEKLVESL